MRRTELLGARVDLCAMTVAGSGMLGINDKVARDGLVFVG